MQKGRLLYIVFILAILIIAAAPHAMAEPQPGDSCAGYPAGAVMRSGGPELGGVFHVMRCTAGNWQAQKPSPAGCPNIGDVCDDGSIFAGDTTMYVTDVNQSTATQWSVEQVDTGADSATSGAANQAWIVANRTLSQYPAFELCETLNRHGHMDWYLPSTDEFSVLYTNRTAIGGFTTNFYWSSTERDSDGAWLQRFSDGGQNAVPKTMNSFDVRCIRRG